MQRTVLIIFRVGNVLYQVYFIGGRRWFGRQNLLLVKVATAVGARVGQRSIKAAFALDFIIGPGQNGVEKGIGFQATDASPVLQS